MFLFGVQHWISPHSQVVAELLLGKIQPSVVFQVLLKLWPIIGFLLDQFLLECSIFVVIDFIRPPCNGGVATFSHIAPYNSLWFQEGNILLVFNLNYSFFFLAQDLFKPDDLVGSLHIEFLSSNHPPHGPGPFHRIWHSSVVLYRLPCSVQIFDI